MKQESAGVKPEEFQRSIWATVAPPPPDHHDRTPVDAGRRHYVARAARKPGCLGRGEMPAGVPGKGGGTRKKWNAEVSDRHE